MNILILGANSAIAKETARLMACENHSFYLASRNETALQDLKLDLVSRGAEKVECKSIDLSDTKEHIKLLSEVRDNFNDEVDLVLIAYGILGDQEACESNFSECEKMLQVNLTSTLSLLNKIAAHMEEKKSGHIVCISSVAGDRGRKKNYVYGASKAAITIILSGLRQRLVKSGVHVLTVKPGFVDTPMTENVEKGLLFVSPQKVAKDIIKAIKKKKEVIYTPSFWMIIMLVLKLIPEKIFKKLNF